jgi:hypothetical protein
MGGSIGGGMGGGSKLEILSATLVTAARGYLAGGAEGAKRHTETIEAWDPGLLKEAVTHASCSILTQGSDGALVEQQVQH